MAEDVTQLLDAAAAGDAKAASDLLPLVYDELRKLAAARMAAETPGQHFKQRHSYTRHTSGLFVGRKVGVDMAGDISLPPPSRRCDESLSISPKQTIP